MSAIIAAACCCRDELYAGGNLGVSSGAPTTNLAAWTGSDWSTFAVGPTDADQGLSGDVVRAMVVHDGDLYVTGGSAHFVADHDSLTPEGVEVNNIMRWDGADWSALGNGIDATGTGSALLSWNGTLILAGDFTSVDSVSADNIAAWGPSSWSALGDGLDSIVETLCEFNGDLVAGGWFTSSGATTIRRVARWNGEDWSEVGGGVNDRVLAALEWDDGSRAGNALYIGGEFTTAGVGLAEQTTVNKIARWGRVIFDSGTVEIVDGVVTLTGPEDWPSWAADASLWIGETEYVVDTRDSDTQITLEDTGVNVSAGTEFELLSDDPHWSDLPDSDMTETRDVTAMVIHDDQLIISRGTAAIINIRLWTGDDWNVIGSPNASVAALSSFDDELYVGGRFTFVGSTAAKRIARWDGSQWHAIGSGEGGGVGRSFRPEPHLGNDPTSVNALVSFDDILHVGGSFHVVSPVGGPTFREGNPQVHRQRWNRVSGGAQGAALTFSRYADQPVIGGSFGTPGTTPIGSDPDNRMIARLVGSTWSPLGAGLVNGGGIDGVFALVVYNGDLIAGGNFTETPGGAEMEHVGRWDGSQWHAMDSGLAFVVHALAVYAGDLYAGGVAGGLWRWDGVDWSEISAINSIRAMAVYDGDLYFTSDNAIHRYDGSTSEFVVDFTPGAIRAMITWFDPVAEVERLIVGGDFTDSVAGERKAIAQYTAGVGDEAMGDGFDDTRWIHAGVGGATISVFALAVHDGDLIAGGNFTASGATRTRRVARWNGSSWSEVSGGFNDIVRALLG